MRKFIPIEKMSKKARRELAREKRRMWTVPPVSRIIENKKHDNRVKKSHDRFDDGSMGLFYVDHQQPISCCGV